MPSRVIRAEADDTTRDRILKAAMLRFSAHSYEDTGLRDLAGDVGVDMAYVHRSFGSKEKLFYEAVKATLQPARVFAADRDELPAALAQEILTGRGANEIRSLDILVRSFSSPDASRVLHRVMSDDFIAPLVAKCEGVGQQRAALVGAFLVGVGILRDVIGAESLQEGEGGTLERLISQVIAGLLDVETAEGEATSGVAAEQPKPQ
ncbi:TetR family transcriptional regulator [Rhizobiaceae bacterium BDR2-2]|uniref:TetR family transcriptional regulator n=1 Tax=Ectorhizobium quercum TaxID=2965071 RepID=A0AAE3N3E8_9HYPH|nr:TetR family transcriptional regulator [Ectorhizobium quercum]MCX8999874.1 TetR family transcriptional regulator [Ectorhizobium quercum]